MSTQAYSKYNGLHAWLFGGTLSIQYSSDDGFNPLEHCKFAKMTVSEAIGREPGQPVKSGDTLTFKLSDHAELLVYVSSTASGDLYGTADFVLTLDRDALDKAAHACPICAYFGPFEAYPAIKCIMAADGTMSMPEEEEPDIQHDPGPEVHCTCGYYASKYAFLVSEWDEYEE
jgi:hypothetical protein